MQLKYAKKLRSLGKGESRMTTTMTVVKAHPDLEESEVEMRMMMMRTTTIATSHSNPRSPQRVWLYGIRTVEEI